MVIKRKDKIVTIEIENFQDIITFDFYTEKNAIFFENKLKEYETSKYL